MNSRCILLAVFLLASCCNVAGQGSGQESTTNVVAKTEPTTLAAPYRLWIPEGCETVRVVFAINMRAAGKRVYFHDRQWRNLATRSSAAMMWCGFEAHDVQDSGGGESMLQALRQFAVQTGRAEIADAPLLLWGHSMGGRVAQDFTNWKPDRVAGFVIALRGNPSPPEFMVESAAAMRVPGLYLMGELDGKPDDIRQHFVNSRRADAPRAWVWLPSQRHWPKGMSFKKDQTTDDDWYAWSANEVLIPWIESIVEQRIDPSGKLIPVDMADGWTVKGKSLKPARDFDGAKERTSWLPNERTAKAYGTFIDQRRNQGASSGF